MFDCTFSSVLASTHGIVIICPVNVQLHFNSCLSSAYLMMMMMMMMMTFELQLLVSHLVDN